MIDTIRYKDGKMYIIDQTKLPTTLEILEIDNVGDCWDAIKKLKVRGAPSIGIAAAYGVFLGVKEFNEEGFNEFYKKFEEVSDYLASSRPTAVNLFWALERMGKVVLENKEFPVKDIKLALEKEAILIQKEDEETCRKIGENGPLVLNDGMTVLTHCNAGRLATSKYGTALAPIYVAKEMGMNIKVFADETRPLLQGARLTAFELQEAGVDVTLITDSMAAMVMAEGKIDIVIVGCDRVAANGDTANKIGTYGVALLAKAHNIPFYVAGPLSTIDLTTPTGKEIPIEERDPEEIINGFGKQTAPSNIKVYNPAFDVTPNELITGIITEKGIATAPYDISIKRLFDK
ncbi:MAG: S-methyl-5-thioribose-1-phosphate isomerase [Tissierellaceae bacterium]|nr:S-methyl-5-thioribose-1-phosphate isomerase [Tissierellaceae bacterium]